jgi:hypothetical protein
MRSGACSVLVLQSEGGPPYLAGPALRAASYTFRMIRAAAGGWTSYEDPSAGVSACLRRPTGGGELVPWTERTRTDAPMPPGQDQSACVREGGCLVPERQLTSGSAGRAVRQLSRLPQSGQQLENKFPSRSARLEGWILGALISYLALV